MAMQSAEFYNYSVKDRTQNAAGIFLFCTLRMRKTEPIISLEKLYISWYNLYVRERQKFEAGVYGRRKYT